MSVHMASTVGIALIGPILIAMGILAAMRRRTI
jgi:hypothetical protein